MINIINTWNLLVNRCINKLSVLQKDTSNINPLALHTNSELYLSKVYTVVPKDFDITHGILPEDQGFSKKYVFLWDNWRDLVVFSSEEWKKISLYLPKNVKFDKLTRIPGNGYGIAYIPNTWKIEEQNLAPQYNL